MRPEAPIFFLSPDNVFLDVRRDTDDAEAHLSKEHAAREQSVQELLYFDGLARPLDPRPGGGGVTLTVAHLATDPWQVRVRALEAIRRRGAWVAAQEGAFVLEGKEVSPEEAARRFEPLTAVDLDMSFAKFATLLVDAFDPPQEHPGSFLHNLFHH
jgi:hypothetical protein